MTKAYYMNEKMEPVWVKPVEMELGLGVGGVAWKGGVGLLESKSRDVLHVKEWLKDVSTYFREKKTVVSGWWGEEDLLEEVAGLEGWGLLVSVRPSGKKDCFWVEPERLLKFSSSPAAMQY